MSNRVWDARSNRFVDREKYEEELYELMRIATIDGEDFKAPTGEEVAFETVKEEGLKLRGQIILEGEVAEAVRQRLNFLGYKDFKYTGNLIKILPEDRTFEDFVGEAILWYLREVGLNLAHNAGGLETKVKAE